MEQYGSFIGTLMQSRNQAHVYHLQTDSYAQHVALQVYYEEIVGLIDTLVESFQGRYGILRGYNIVSQIKEDGNPIMYFDALCKYVETKRISISQDSYIQNEIDNVVALIESTRYRLKNLH